MKLTLARWGPSNHFNILINGWPSGLYMSKYPTELAYSKGLLSHGDQITKHVGTKFLKFSGVLIIFFISVTKSEF